MKNLNYLKKIIFDKTFFYSSIIIFFLGFLSTFLELIGLASIPVLFSAFYDPNSIDDYFFIPNFITNIIKNGNLVLNISILVTIIFLIKNLILSFIYYFEASFCKKINFFLTSKFYKMYINSPYKLIYNHNSSTLIRYVLTDTQNTTIFIQNFIVFLREIILVLFIVAYLFYSNFLTSIVIVIFLMLSVLSFYSLVRKRVNRFSTNIQEIEKKQMQNINELFTSIEFLKTTNKEYFFSNTFNSLIKDIEKNRFYINFLTKIPKLFLEVAGVASIIITVVVFNFIYEDQTAILSFLVILGVSTLRLIPAFNLITTSLVLMRSCSVSLRRLNIELEIYNQKIQKSENVKNFNNKIITANNLNIKNLSFSYENEKNYIFKDINFSMNSGESLLIIGKSGSGKTTLIKNILGLLEPTEGEINIDNENIFSNLYAWRSQIGYIPQRVFLNDDSICKNIAFGIEEKNIDKDRVRECIKLVNLEEFVDKLDKKIDTKLKKIETQISGGQLQRIGIARAIYNKPLILIMDEPTSSIDEETELNILNSLKNIKTVKFKIIVSHRKKTKDFCDKMISFN